MIFIISVIKLLILLWVPIKLILMMAGFNFLQNTVNADVSKKFILLPMV